MSTTNQEQRLLWPEHPIGEKIYDADGVVQLENLGDRLFLFDFDPERPITMPNYMGAIGVCMADRPRENNSTDSALGVYGNDFRRADPRNLVRGLYKPYMRGTRRQKPFVNPMTWETQYTARQLPGLQAVRTSVAVNEDLYDLILGDPASRADRIANRTERVNRNGNLEAAEDLGGESAFYDLFEQHIGLETAEQDLKERREGLVKVYRSLTSGASHPKRIQNLEPFRILAEEDIQEMVRVACHGLGTTQTKSTMLAVASNMHRSPDNAKFTKEYALMAIHYNGAILGKIDQAIRGVMTAMSDRAIHLINNIDREYTD